MCAQIRKINNLSHLLKALHIFCIKNTKDVSSTLEEELISSTCKQLQFTMLIYEGIWKNETTLI